MLPQNDTLRGELDVLRKHGSGFRSRFWRGTLALARKQRDGHVEEDFLTGDLRVYKGEVMGLNHSHTVLQHLNKHSRP